MCCFTPNFRPYCILIKRENIYILTHPKTFPTLIFPFFCRRASFVKLFNSFDLKLLFFFCLRLNIPRQILEQIIILTSSLHHLNWVTKTRNILTFNYLKFDEI